jgi:hypothetical protein
VLRSRPAHRFVRLRQHVMARLSAITFMVLILLPFTAPFSTYHLNPGHRHPFEALPKEFKDKLDSDEDLILPTDFWLSLPAWSDVSVRASVGSNRIADHLVQHVLRL